jgi:hypothetical protein
MFFAELHRGDLDGTAHKKRRIAGLFGSFAWEYMANAAPIALALN